MRLFAMTMLRPLGYEMVHLPLNKVADTPFHIEGREKVSIDTD